MNNKQSQNNSFHSDEAVLLPTPNGKNVENIMPDRFDLFITSEPTAKRIR